MKKKIIIGFVVLGTIFMLGGVYIVFAIEKGTSTLDRLILLHQVEILREHLLIQLKKVETDLSLKNTRFARGVDDTIKDVRDLGSIADSCFDCHHDGEVYDRLLRLKTDIEEYEVSISRVLTIRANSDRMEEEEQRAFKIGEKIITRTSNMIAFTTAKLGERTNKSLSQIANARMLLYAFMLSQIFIATGLAYVFIRSVTKPAGVLLEATRRLKSGDLDFRIEGLKDEFGEVASSFNEMSSSLKKHMQDTQRAEQMKMVGIMAAGLAHEIKNPLAGIQISMEVLKEESSLTEEDQSTLNGVIREIQRINTLMKSLLEFARPQKPQLTSVNVSKILDTTINVSFKQALSSNNASRINIARDYDQSLPEIVADPAKLQQVFLNLFLNAVAAMPDGGTLTLRTAHNEENKTIEISISDTGGGIPENIKDKIFQPFFTRAKGTGLGLAMSKQLIEQHGGTISAENNPGEGATFRIILPEAQLEKEQTT